jgi:Domain of unknown function (DUF4350)
MTGDAIFSTRLLIGWIVAAVLTFAVSLYLMSSGDQGNATVGPSTYSRSAIGYAGIADVLQRLDIAVLKSRSDSLGQLTPGSVLVLAEPLPGGKTEETMRALLKADTILLVLPKWTGQPSQHKAAWLGEASLLDAQVAAWALHLVAPQADVLDVEQAAWTTNALKLSPTIEAPIRLMHGDRLRPIIGNATGMLLGELTSRTRKIWVLSDPDVIANHGLGLVGNAALAVALIERLRSSAGNVVFDETIHGFAAQTANPLLLLFRFPFVMATIQAATAIALLLWAALGRFGTPQPAPQPMSAGRQGLLENVAKLVEFTGHHEVMVKRYVLETLRDAGRQLHAPRGLSTTALIGWLQRVGTARGVAIDCAALIKEAATLEEGQRRNPAALVRLARQIHRWKGEVVDGRSGNPRNR